jgi:hypothetical protein
MSKARMVVIGLWFLLVGVILIWTIVAYSGEIDATYRREILLRHLLLMITLSTPIGWLLMFILGVLFYWIENWFGLQTTEIVNAILVSVVCGIGGYIQWFVLLPWLWRKWKARCACKSP